MSKHADSEFSRQINFTRAASDPCVYSTLKRMAALVAITLSFAIHCIAQNPISFSIKSQGPLKALLPGDRLIVLVVARIEDGWHLYSTNQQASGPIATRITVPPPQPFKLAGAVKAPPPLIELDPNFGLDTQFY